MRRRGALDPASDAELPAAAMVYRELFKGLKWLETE
jgi:hypothetical protein